MNQIINMIIRQVMRQVVNRGINAGFDQASKIGKRGQPAQDVDEPQMTREERQAQRGARQQARQVGKDMNAVRRVTKF
jgi:hypothetical protein